MIDCQVLPAGDGCLIVTFADRLDSALNARCIALADDLRARGLAGTQDVVPTYHTVAVYFDPIGGDAEGLTAEIEQAVRRLPAVATDIAPVIEIPVRYGGADGPDLPFVADAAGCSEQDAVRLHAGTVYRVFMLGFLPGFAYLGPLDPRIAVPRLETPRSKVSAGSVGIAGRQTGIYPLDSPGGWRIIGRTAVLPFDPMRSEAFLFKPGDRVRFVPVGESGPAGVARA